MLYTLEDFRRFTPDMPTYALLGDPLGHSISRELHALLFAQKGVDARYIYIVTPPEQLCEVLTLAQQKLCGFNCTIPLKELVAPHLQAAQTEGLASVNTIAVKADGLHGFNTDAPGFLDSLQTLFEDMQSDGLQHEHVVILGSGGTARTVVACLHNRCASLHIAARNRVAAQKIADLYPAKITTLDELQQQATILVNTTSVGMYPQMEASPVRLKNFPSARAVYDVIYNPQETLLLREAKQHGLKTQNGLAMLVKQAALAQGIWCGYTFSAAELLAVQKELALLLAVRRIQQGGVQRNIILSGFMGAGKSTIGRLLAQRLDYDFLDTDVYIEQETGQSVADIFATQGESYFRRCEQALCQKIQTMKKTVVATGGGMLLSRENYDNLSAGGTVVFLDAPIVQIEENLAASEVVRPLLSTRNMRELYEQRHPIYTAHCDSVAAIQGDKLQNAIDVLQYIL